MRSSAAEVEGALTHIKEDYLELSSMQRGKRAAAADTSTASHHSSAPSRAHLEPRHSSNIFVR